MSQGERVAAREGCGRTLAELGKEHEDFPVLNADLVGSTKTVVFRKASPERRINCDIAEQNMIGVAAGIAATGRVAFASSFAMFAADRAYERVRDSVDYPQLNMKIATTHGGISVGEDGATHRCSEDFALMRTIPGMVVMVPSGDVEAGAMVHAACMHRGPVYMHSSHLATPVFSNPETCRSEVDKTITIREGKDIAAIATNLPVTSAMEAAEKLAAEGIEARVVDIHTIKPLDEEAVLRAAREIGKVVTVEKHSVIGGLGSAIAEVLAGWYPAKLRRVGIYDRCTESGPAEALIYHCGLDGEGVHSAVKAFPA